MPLFMGDGLLCFVCGLFFIVFSLLIYFFYGHDIAGSGLVDHRFGLASTYFEDRQEQQEQEQEQPANTRKYITHVSMYHADTHKLTHAYARTHTHNPTITGTETETETAAGACGTAGTETETGMATGIVIAIVIGAGEAMVEVMACMMAAWVPTTGPSPTRGPLPPGVVPSKAAAVTGMVEEEEGEGVTVTGVSRLTYGICLAVHCPAKVIFFVRSAIVFCERYFPLLYVVHTNCMRRVGEWHGARHMNP